MAVKRILLSTFTLRITDQTNTYVNLDNFNNDRNFYKFLNGFFDEVYKTVKQNPSLKDKSTLHLRLKNKIDTDETERSFSGYLSSGVRDDKYTVMADGVDEPAFEADPNKHVTFRDLFFYIETPPQKEYAHVIIQKTKMVGAKHLLQDTLTKYLRENHYYGFRAILLNSLDKRVYNKMMQYGNLKKIDLIKRTIPNSIDEYYQNTSKEYSSKGTLITSIQSRLSLTDYWKGFVDNLYNRSSKNSKIEIGGGEEYDEVDFVLEYNGKIKTFHVQHRSKTQPDIDVTSDVLYDEGTGEPTTESLINVSKDLVRDVLTLKPVNAK